MNDLKGCTIIVTRPARQADGLLSKLRHCGAQAVHFPVISIEAIAPSSLTGQANTDPQNFDIVIFISRNAVDYGLPLLTSTTALPATLKVAAVGPGTAAQLESHGVSTDICPHAGSSSEQLLNEAGLADVQEQQVLIVRGVGGRELLADSLRQRGAVVTYLECYHRVRPAVSSSPLSQLWRNASVNAIIVTSSEALRNLYDMVDSHDRNHLNTTPLYVISLTMVEQSAKLGYLLKPVLMASARDEDVITALHQHCRSE